MERERYDGADVSICGRGRPTGLATFAERFAALAGAPEPPGQFGTSTPRTAERSDKVMRSPGRLQEEITSPPRRQVGQGTLLSRSQYLTDIEKMGYRMSAWSWAT